MDYSKQAFEHLFKDNYPQMYRMAFSMVENADDAKDAVNQVFTQEPVDKQAQLKEQITKQMNQEALRILGIVSEMPRWTPGKQSGKPVRMRYTVPIIFRPSETS